jgi:uncharacterized protein YutE (UPF0331/DUF86 family)
MDDIVLTKKESIERCVRQAKTYYVLPRQLSFEKDYLVQDAIAANLQRACDLCVDLTNHTIKVMKLGLPRDSKESFTMLGREGVIPGQMATGPENMVGFRNILVHQYRDIDLDLMVDVIEEHLDDLIAFTNLTAAAVGGQPELSAGPLLN